MAAFAGVLVLNWTGVRLTLHAITRAGEDMSLVEQAIARMKNQAGAAKRKVDTAAKPVVPAYRSPTRQRTLTASLRNA